MGFEGTGFPSAVPGVAASVLPATVLAAAGTGGPSPTEPKAAFLDSPLHDELTSTSCRGSLRRTTWTPEVRQCFLMDLSEPKW